MSKITYHQSRDSNPEDVEYTICENDVEIGYAFREVYYCLNGYHRMMEYGINAELEERFGDNAFSGHTRIRSLVKEIQKAVNEGR